MSADTLSPVEAEPTPAAPPIRPTLLVCDDEDGPREALRAIFRSEFDVLSARSGPEAIALVQNNRVDVAVSDIRMAGMSGIEVLERLKFVDPGIQVVMMTAFETTDTLRQALKLQAFDYINKPFDVTTVRSAVNAALQKRRLNGHATDGTDRINALFAELQHHKVEEQISRARNEIYGSIIHDINGPLTVISGFLQIMNQRVAGMTEPTAADLEFIRDRLKTITRQTSSCIEISRRYLSFLRRSECDDTPRIGVNQLLADMNQLVRVHPSLGQHTFTVHPLERDVAVRMNGTDLIQILRNLVVNAFQAGPLPFSVEVGGQVLADAVDLSQLRDGPENRVLNVENFDNTTPTLVLTVRDSGPGIPPEVLPKMFQTNFTTKSARHGTGLGLSIILRLVREARGVIHLQTRIGRGTSFTLYLPAHTGPVAPRPA
jgi:signal transduction histidine kinase